MLQIVARHSVKAELCLYPNFKMKEMKGRMTVKDLDALTYELIGAAIQVHKELGPGLLESVYHYCMLIELKHRKINFLTEYKIPFSYRNETLPVDFRCDLFVDERMVVELKAVKDLHAIQESQLLTYMRLLEVPKGMIINFSCNNIFHEGQKTFVNDHFRNLPKE
jgi:GxxExxY protein